LILTYQLMSGSIFAVIILWSIGLVIYAMSLPHSVENTNIVTDAIVVPTGGSGRLIVGLELLDTGKAKRLFVSGVHSEVTFSSIVDKKDEHLVACCIDLGKSAIDTQENAQESAAWMRRNGYTSLRLVTGSYHMPRAMLEFNQAMPGITLISHPTFPKHVKINEWWHYRGTTGLLATEYAKYILALFRTNLGFTS